jgi:hypothetical protein
MQRTESICINLSTGNERNIEEGNYGRRDWANATEN